VYQSRIENDADINAQTLAQMEARIPQATAVIAPGVKLDVVVYGCTSGAMVIGEPTVHARIREARPGVACTTPMEATFAALRALGASRIALVTPYLDSINRSMRAHVADHGFQVPVMGSWNIPDDNTVARLSPGTVRDAVLELGAEEDVDAVFVSCTSVRLVEQVEALEAELGKPITSSNHATAWHCLRLAGIADPVSGFGRLFRTPLR
jgi:maleate isomerase